jgi:LysM repeat protein
MFTKVVSLVFLALPFITQYASAKCSRTYVVKEGDYCDSISQANNVSTYQLAVVNQGVMDCTKLYPGQSICLGIVGEDCKTTYIVRDGDTCDGIQAKTGINATLLYTNNPQINKRCTNIYIGEVLCVANVVAVPAAPSGGVSSVVVPPSTAVPANPGATSIHPHHSSPHSYMPPHHSPTLTHAPAAHSPTPSPDDDDLPYCDEL